MEESLSVFACRMSEIRKQALANRATANVESRARRLELLRKVDPVETNKLIEGAKVKIHEAAKKGLSEAMILTFVDNDVVRPPENQVSWCLPQPDWLIGNYREIFRHFEKEKGTFHPCIRDWINQSDKLQGYAIWVQIP